MKNLKKTGLAALIAMLTFGFSAFTTIKKSRFITYYKVSYPWTSASSPTGYEYYEGDRCQTDGEICSAVWDIGLNPVPIVDGTLIPAVGVSFVSGSEFPGHFE